MSNLEDVVYDCADALVARGATLIERHPEGNEFCVFPERYRGER